MGRLKRGLIFLTIRGWEKEGFKVFLIIIVRVYVVISYLFLLNNKLFTIISASTIFFIKINQLWFMYLIYEISIIPMLLIILSIGLNPYRFNAFYFMIIYSFIFSLPAIVLISLNIKNLCFLQLLIETWFKRSFSIFILLIIFFVKRPIYLLHFWLPKAHVEASTLGSIVLARFILKIGTLGLMKIVKWSNFKATLNLSYFIISLFAIRVVCLAQSDFKKLIAFTSIIHVTTSLLVLINCRGTIKGLIIINLNHSFSRSLIFYFRGIINKISHSRIIYLQSHIKWGLISFLIRLVLLLNLGVPPFYRFAGELIFFRLVIVENFFFLVLRCFIICFITLYRLLILRRLKPINCTKVYLNQIVLFFLIGLSLILLWFLK